MEDCIRVTDLFNDRERNYGVRANVGYICGRENIARTFTEINETLKKTTYFNAEETAEKIHMILWKNMWKPPVNIIGSIELNAERTDEWFSAQTGGSVSKDGPTPFHHEFTWDSFA